MSDQAEIERYEVRDYAAKSSQKKYHVWDRETQREVFHTNNRERAETLVRLAGDATITQHLKDYGHQFVTSGKGYQGYLCQACKRR